MDNTITRQFDETIQQKTTLTEQLSKLNDEHDAYKIELFTGLRDPDPTYEYEWKIAADRIKGELRGVEKSIEALAQIANPNSKLPDAPKFRELFERAGMGHRLNGSIPRPSQPARRPQPESPTAIVGDDGKVYEPAVTQAKWIIAGLFIFGAFVVRQILLSVGHY